MQDNWVDFKAIKAAVGMQVILDRYQINWLRKSGGELRGRCPIHLGEGQNSFHVHLTKNAFNCFSCKARGNVLDFVAAMEKCSVRDAALKLQGWYSVPEAAMDTAKAETAKSGESDANKLLTFRLKGIDHAHPYLAERGITKETAETFGVGYFGGKGSMHGRIVIPIHDERGELVAYAGRAIDGTEPRYKVSAGFNKSAELFNIHRVIEPDLVVAKGFFDCMKIWQSGYPAVAILGGRLSERQEALLVANFQGAILMLDADETGRNTVAECLTRLGPRMWVRSVTLPAGSQPNQLSADDIHALLATA